MKGKAKAAPEGFEAFVASVLRRIGAAAGVPRGYGGRKEVAV